MWLPFLLHTKSLFGVNFGSTGMDRIVSNFDGINFLIVAKSAYNPEIISNNYQDMLNGRKSLYFSAHYPGLPLVISFFDIFTTGPNALLASIILSNILLAASLYLFFEAITKDKKVALLLSTIALFFPARMLATRIVGSNEPLFIFFVLTSLTAFLKNQRWLSAILGTLAVLTRSPGILLFGAYGLYYGFSRDEISTKIKNFYPYLLIPTALLLLWTYYGFQFGDFLAYFQVGGNINLYWPFAVFGSSMDWVSGIWNEDLIYLFFLISAGVIYFYKKIGWSPVSLFAIIYGIFVMSVAHRDLARYSLPIMPMILIGARQIFEQKYVKYICILMLIPICLYTWQFVLGNYQPIIDWSRYL